MIHSITILAQVHLLAIYDRIECISIGMASPSGVVEMRRLVKHALYTRVPKHAYFESKQMNKETHDYHIVMII